MANPRYPKEHWNCYRPTYDAPPNTQGPAGIHIPLSLSPSPTTVDTSTRPPTSPPHLWPASLDHLMGRTVRAYDLVTNYARDSHGGTRWAPEDIARVHACGKQLHSVIRVLQAWSRCAARDVDAQQLRDDARDVEQACNLVQSVISCTERKKPCEG
ncbi:hypothetical protein BDU57DRAFT_100782 [Ampelomyces quisqualis]|uniref:Uncharacterized protein n=1 Tax=Ampelomyces quisqualis TaxID=50730 RepID=A0A6A5Q784_AMPQU|nr:hypothetical protein BDU57DRAFT_100782 [Ampelomyces quisqualis]